MKISGLLVQYKKRELAMAHIPRWCGVCKGTTPVHFCDTENKYICRDCNHFCHKLAHNWRELSDEEINQARKES